ncbi:UvrD-helicase domain-containing protein [Pendulispora brunnea]|uniref:UvrD-helicase domain-containing protein n=2 Tax=Pendulispora brunnea TaxID=2905690 RepID=A0ABZ2JYN4_9BACT
MIATIVGDPKQSIYRFRRADVAMYDEVRRKVLASRPVETSLSTSYRASPALLAWQNRALARVLGSRPGDGRLFERTTGKVYFATLEPGRTPRCEWNPGVISLPYGCSEPHPAGD